MTKTLEYTQHAHACRRLAKQMDSGNQRDQLIKMAETWETLAADRTTLVLRHPELGLAGEHQEEVRVAKSHK